MGDERHYLTFLVVAVTLLVLVQLLRWTFSRGRSVVSRPAGRGRPDEYGLLVSVAEPGTFVEAEVLAARLRDAGLRATLAPTSDGPRVMVFESDRRRALQVLSRPAPGG